MKIIFNALLIFFSVASFVSKANAVDHGAFGEFVPSLVKSKDSYQVIDDPTKTAPAQIVEKFELKNGSCAKIPEWNDCKNDRERVELKQRNSVVINNQIIKYEWKFYLEKTFSNIWPVKLSIAQFYDDKADRPIWMFQINSAGLQVENLLPQKSILHTLLSEDELRGQWHHVEVEAKWAKDNSGFFNVWMNGVQKLKYIGPTIISGTYFFKYGLYRSFLKQWTKKEAIPDQIIYFLDVKMSYLKKEKIQ